MKKNRKKKTTSNEPKLPQVRVSSEFLERFEQATDKLGRSDSGKNRSRSALVRDALRPLLDLILESNRWVVLIRRGKGEQILYLGTVEGADINKARNKAQKLAPDLCSYENLVVAHEAAISQDLYEQLDGAEKGATLAMKDLDFESYHVVKK